MKGLDCDRIQGLLFNRPAPDSFREEFGQLRI
jgi:EAL domain-containing protein (putative c-di-GMP-specific phosphodiesterase class I)